MKEERQTKEIYEAEAQGKNKISRPRLRWYEQVRQEVEKRGIRGMRQVDWHTMDIFVKRKTRGNLKVSHYIVLYSVEHYIVLCFIVY